MSDARPNRLPASSKHVSEGPVVKIDTNPLTLVDEKQERLKRVEDTKAKAKGKAIAKRRANLINTRGDELMYKPVGSIVAPTLTGGK